MLKRFFGKRFVCACEGINTEYFDLLPCVRLIYRNGKYDGWYNPRLKKAV